MVWWFVNGRAGETLPSYGNPVGSGENVVNDVSGVARRCGFKDQNFSLAVGHGAMLDAAGHDTKLARLQHHAAVAKLDNHLAAPNEEKLVLLFVLMPREDAGDLYEFQLLPVQFSNHFGPPMLVDKREFFGERELIHRMGREGVTRSK